MTEGSLGWNVMHIKQLWKKWQQPEHNLVLQMIQQIFNNK